jgi:DNA mismatch repair protein MLH1
MPFLFPTNDSYEFFYQVSLSEFGNFGSIEFSEGLNIRQLIELSIESDESDGMTQQSQSEEIDVLPEKSRLIETIVDILIQRREMIAEYFSLTITAEGILTSLPLLLRNYTPHYGKLPSFLLRLGRNVPLCYFTVDVG